MLTDSKVDIRKVMYKSAQARARLQSDIAHNAKPDPGIKLKSPVVWQEPARQNQRPAVKTEQAIDNSIVEESTSTQTVEEQETSNQQSEEATATYAQNGPLTAKKIQHTVAHFYHRNLFDMFSSRRTQNVVRLRGVSMYLCRVILKMSYPEIGRRHRGKDHTTVLHVIRKIAGLVGDTSVLQAPGFAPVPVEHGLVKEIEEIKLQLLG